MVVCKIPTSSERESELVFGIDEYKVLRCPPSEVILFLYKYILSAAHLFIVYENHLTISVLPLASSSRFPIFKMATPMTIPGLNMHMVVDVEHT